MNGKSTIKIMSKTQLIHTLKFGNFQTDIKVQSFKKYSTKKRASSPLVSTSISTQRKNNNQSSLVKKLPKNNFLTASNNLFSVMSCKRLSQCQTAMALRAVKKEDPLIKTQAQKLLLKNSDKIQKLLWNELNQNLPPLIISADFILDQDLFWSQPKINPLIIKNWKQLHKKYFVVWIIKQLKSLKKLKDFTQSNQLPLNSVYYHKRQPKYTIDYSPLRKQINKVYGSELKQIRAIQCLKLNTKDICQSGTFFGRTPLMFDPRFKVYYIRNDQSGFGIQKIVQICKILSTSENKITQLKSIQVFIENQYKKIKSQKQYINNEHSKMITIIDRTQTQFVDQQDAQKEVDKFKRKLIDTIIRQNGRNFQVQGFSTHYFIGDIIKRNYQLLLKNAMKRLKNKQKVLPKLQSQKKQNKIEYKHNQLGIVQKYYQFY